MGRASVKVAMDSGLRKLALLLTVVVLLQALWSAFALRRIAAPEPIAPAQSSLRASDLAYADIDPSQADAIRARPLFWEGRAPFVYTAVETEDEVVANHSDNNAIKGVQLLGVYGSGPSSGIIVRHKNKRSRMRMGDKIGDWEFTMMSADGAIFESGDEIRTLDLTHVVPPAKNAKQRRTQRAAGQAGGKK